MGNRFDGLETSEQCALLKDYSEKTIDLLEELLGAAEVENKEEVAAIKEDIETCFRVQKTIYDGLIKRIEGKG